jgi:hypothetical protein
LRASAPNWVGWVSQRGDGEALAATRASTEKLSLPRGDLSDLKPKGGEQVLGPVLQYESVLASLDLGRDVAGQCVVEKLEQRARGGQPEAALAHPEGPNWGLGTNIAYRRVERFKFIWELPPIDERHPIFVRRRKLQHVTDGARRTPIVRLPQPGQQRQCVLHQPSLFHPLVGWFS